MKTLYLADARILDRIGVFASCICAIHCVVGPLLMTAVPLVGLRFLITEQVEWTFVVLSFAAGLLSLVPAYVSQHGRCRPLFLFSGGLCLILTARLWFEETLQLEVPIVVAGALLIITSHLLNLRLCRACHLCAEGS